jgi:hypothetical protein
MENKILNLLKKIIKEDEDTFIDITDMNDDSAAETVISKNDIFKKLRDKIEDNDRTPAGFEYGEIVSGEMEEGDDMYLGIGDFGFYDSKDRQYRGDFDFDYDEEEYDDFDEFIEKYPNQNWFQTRNSKNFDYRGDKAIWDKYKKVYGGPYKLRKRRPMGENEMEEGNAFSGALAKAKEEGKSSFEVDGKKYQVKEAKEDKFIQKATKKMEKKGTSGKFGEWCKSNGLDKDGEVTKKCIDKAMKSDDSKVVKMANFAKNIGGFKGAKHESIKEKVVFTESELIDFIERLVEAEKVVDKGFKTAMNTTKKENTDAMKQVATKMKDYMKNMGTDYEENPQSFPKGNKIMSREDFGKEVSDDKKKAYKASDAVEEYIDQIARSGGMEVLEYDQIKPDEEWITMNIEGSSKTGNSPEYANAVPTDVNKSVNRRRKLNVLNKLKKQSYQKAEQPVYDVAGENTHMDKMLGISESIEDKKVINDMEKMKKLIGYNQKTQ